GSRLYDWASSASQRRPFDVKGSPLRVAQNGGSIMNVEQRVKEIICSQLEVSPEQVKLEASFTDDLKADSLAVVELVLALEEAFSIEIPDEDTEQIKTVKDAIEYIKAHVSA